MLCDFIFILAYISSYGQWWRCTKLYRAATAKWSAPSGDLNAGSDAKRRAVGGDVQRDAPDLFNPTASHPSPAVAAQGQKNLVIGIKLKLKH
uniref:Uncharacterized protein n=1 Tax=Romanomermis culicivorax TaxID=13658 RepID=A0A915KNX7_ROMCU